MHSGRTNQQNECFQIYVSLDAIQHYLLMPYSRILHVRLAARHAHWRRSPAMGHVPLLATPLQTCRRHAVQTELTFIHK